MKERRKERKKERKKERERRNVTIYICAASRELGRSEEREGEGRREGELCVLE